MSHLTLFEAYPDRIDPHVSVLADGLLARHALTDRLIARSRFDHDQQSGFTYHAFSPWSHDVSEQVFSRILERLDQADADYQVLSLDDYTLSLRISFQELRKATAAGALPSQILRQPGKDGQLYFLEDLIHSGYRLTTGAFGQFVIAEVLSHEHQDGMGLWYAAAEGIVKELF